MLLPALLSLLLCCAFSHPYCRFYMSTTLDMAYQAFDDQCTGANPRYPLVKVCAASGCFVFVAPV
jgi:hypothetical protein